VSWYRFSASNGYASELISGYSGKTTSVVLTVLISIRFMEGSFGSVAVCLKHLGLFLTVFWKNSPEALNLCSISLAVESLMPSFLQAWETGCPRETTSRTRSCLLWVKYNVLWLRSEHICRDVHYSTSSYSSKLLLIIDWKGNHLCYCSFSATDILLDSLDVEIALAYQIRSSDYRRLCC
jgi:hypothetical protein